MRHVQEYDRPNSAYMLFYERAGSGPVTATAALAEDAAPAARQAAVQPLYAAADGVAAASPQPAAGPAAPAPAASPAVAQTAAEPDDAADMVVSPPPPRLAASAAAAADAAASPQPMAADGDAAGGHLPSLSPVAGLVLIGARTTLRPDAQQLFPMQQILLR